MNRYLLLLSIVTLFFSCKNTNSADNYFNSKVIGAGYQGLATTPSTEKPYVPEIIIDKERLIYVAPDSLGNGLSENKPTSFNDAIKKADSAYTIIALNGIYELKLSIHTLKNVTLISKNKWGAKIVPVGSRSDEAAFSFSSKGNFHHVNFIGFEIIGDSHGKSQFIFSPGTSTQGTAHHIYLSNIKMHELKMGIYSGLHSHDWTVDRSEFYNSTMSYMWYCMGFHQTVMNTLMYNNPYLSLAIRGHYPLNENYIWNGHNTLIKDREKPFLSPNDWTHLIINNTFGTVTNTTRTNRGMLGLFYDIVPEEPNKSEACYFPPQNVTIANNVFVDNGPQNKIPFYIYASRGINTGAISSVNGITFKNNITSQSQMILGGNTTNIHLITDTINNAINAKHLGFVNEKNNDYNLTKMSTDLIDKSAEDLYRTNIDNNGKSRNNTPDIGAFEYEN